YCHIFLHPLSLFYFILTSSTVLYTLSLHDALPIFFLSSSISLYSLRNSSYAFGLGSYSSSRCFSFISSVNNKLFIFDLAPPSFENVPQFSFPKISEVISLFFFPSFSVIFFLFFFFKFCIRIFIKIICLNQSFQKFI